MTQKLASIKTAAPRVRGTTRTVNRECFFIGGLQLESIKTSLQKGRVSCARWLQGTRMSSAGVELQFIVLLNDNSEAEGADR